MLDEAIEYLENRQKEYSKFTYEVIVVSDGSRDQTVEVAQSYAQKFGTDKVRCLKLIKNRGKGGAVRLVSFTISISIYNFSQLTYYYGISIRYKNYGFILHRAYKVVGVRLFYSPTPMVRRNSKTYPNSSPV